MISSTGRGVQMAHSGYDGVYFEASINPRRNGNGSGGEKRENSDIPSSGSFSRDDDVCHDMEMLPSFFQQTVLTSRQKIPDVVVRSRRGWSTSVDTPRRAQKMGESRDSGKT
jgi:hypothetical protein